MKNVAGLLMLAVAPLVASCTTTRAQVPIERPALEVPPVPPRVIEPAPVETPMPEPVPDLPAAAPAPQRPRPPARDPQREPPKPESKPEAPPVEPPPPTPPPATVPPLRTAATGDAARAEREVRATLARAQGMLDKVDYNPLSDVRKKAYQETQLFIKQAEDALKESNLLSARKLAEKAETMAKELQGR
jgi:hypothetical protein